MSTQFESDKLLADEAEKFIEENGKLLLLPLDYDKKLVSIKRFVPEKGYYSIYPDDVKNGIEPHYSTETIRIEGGDLFALAAELSSEDTFLQGWIEVKRPKSIGTICFSPDLNPALSFEIHSKKTGEYSGTPGWLLRWMDPLRSLEDQKDTKDNLRTKAPTIIVFCLYDAPQLNSTLRAIVSFYEVDKLLAELDVMGKAKYGWNLRSWDVEPKTQMQKDRFNKQITTFNGRLWKVSLVELKERGVPMLITTFGEHAEPEKNKFEENNKIRYDTFYAMADSHFDYADFEKLKNSVHEQSKLTEAEITKINAKTGMNLRTDTDRKYEDS